MCRTLYRWYVLYVDGLNADLDVVVGVGGEGIGAMVDVPEGVHPAEDDEVMNAQFAQLRANQQFWAPHGRASAHGHFML